MSCENERSEQRKRLEVVLEGAIESPRSAVQRFNRLISRTRRPAIPALKTRRMGSCRDVDEAQAGRERQQRKLDRHESVHALAAQRLQRAYTPILRGSADVNTRLPKWRLKAAAGRDGSLLAVVRGAELTPAERRDLRSVARLAISPVLQRSHRSAPRSRLGRGRPGRRRWHGADPRVDRLMVGLLAEDPATGCSPPAWNPLRARARNASCPGPPCPPR